MQNDLPTRDDMVTFAEVLRRNALRHGRCREVAPRRRRQTQFAPARKFGWDDNRLMFNRGYWKKLEESATGPRVAATNARGEPTYDVAGADPSRFDLEQDPDELKNLLNSPAHREIVRRQSGA